nr:hypothetical protein [Deltaproteobacteria bacterium]
EDAKGSDTACTTALTSTQLDKLTKKFDQIVLEDVKSREVPVVAETPTAPVGIDPTAAPSSDAGSAAGSAAAGSGSAVAVVDSAPEQLPPICGDYKEQIAKLAGCRRIKADIKKGLRESYDLIVDGWNRVGKKTDAIRTSIEGICKKGVDSIVDLRKSHCR